MSAPGYHSQFGEDKWIVDHLTLPEKGVFVEVGAADGVEFSNTLHFERKGWTGLCVEPDPRHAKRLQENRTCATCIEAVDVSTGHRVFPMAPNPLLSGFRRETPAQTALVEVSTLADIIARHLPGTPDIDLLSIDTEGTELKVWESIGSIRPGVVIVEWYTEGIPSDKGEVVRRFVEDGYLLVHESPCNLIFQRRATAPDAAPVLLNLGAGEYPVEGYVNLDRKTGSEVYPLAYPDNSADVIRASHVLEHFSFRETLDVVKEWARVLKPGGTLKIAVPDFDYCHRAYAEGTDPNVEAYLFGSHNGSDSTHGAMFNEGKLRELMRLAGIVGIRRWESEVGDCATLPVSLNLMGTKRQLPTSLEGTAAVMSMPRYGFTDPLICLMEMTSKMKIPVYIRRGVYWHSSLTESFEMAMENHPTAQYLMAIDFDTVFQVEHVLELHRLMNENPDVAALFPIQIGRERDEALLTVKGEDGNNSPQVSRADVDAELLNARTGHFGLTLIRTDALRKLPKPWFTAIPAKNGGWGEGRIDADIYFWRLMEQAGMRVCQANTVRVGHWQEVISWADKNLEPIHQYANAYRREGPPAEVL